MKCRTKFQQVVEVVGLESAQFPASTQPQCIQLSLGAARSGQTPVVVRPSMNSTDTAAAAAPAAAPTTPAAAAVAAPSGSTRVAIVGCSHGELDHIYSTISAVNAASPHAPIDLLICCGDFQCCRNLTDLQCMACPPKYRALHSFYQYYSGAKTAPVLTLFIGGNHEASSYLAELFSLAQTGMQIYKCCCCDGINCYCAL